MQKSSKKYSDLLIQMNVRLIPTVVWGVNIAKKMDNRQCGVTEMNFGKMSSEVEFGMWTNSVYDTKEQIC